MHAGGKTIRRINATTSVRRTRELEGNIISFADADELKADFCRSPATALKLNCRKETAGFPAWLARSAGSAVFSIYGATAASREFMATRNFPSAVDWSIVCLGWLQAAT